MSDNLQHLSTAELGERFATASTSDEAARIAAELEQRARHATAAELLESEQRLIRLAARRRMIDAPRVPHTSGAICALLKLGADVRPAPINTDHEHAPCAERVRHTRRGRRGWLLESNGSGTLSLVLWRRGACEHRHPLEWVATSETRLGWSA